MNIPAFIEGILLVFVLLCMVYVLAFALTTYYEILHQKIKWKVGDEKFDKAMNDFQENYVIVDREKYNELKKVN